MVGDGAPWYDVVYDRFPKEASMGNPKSAVRIPTTENDGSILPSRSDVAKATNTANKRIRAIEMALGILDRQLESASPERRASSWGVEKESERRRLKDELRPLKTDQCKRLLKTKPPKRESRTLKKAAAPPETPKPPEPATKERAQRFHKINSMEPDFITKLELARHLCCSTTAIDDWIEHGTIPYPRSRPGQRHPVWLRRHYKAYVETGEWPREAFGD
jgi:hypothetical protein